MSTDAKTLYGILLDRMGLSVKNGWLDEQGRVYIIFPVQEVMDALGCADNKATKLFRELSGFQDKQERSSVLSQLKAKCDMPECNPTKCRKGRNDHAI